MVVIGLKGDEYTVEMTDYGWSCDCPKMQAY